MNIPVDSVVVVDGVVVIGESSTDVEEETVSSSLAVSSFEDGEDSEF